MAIYSNQGAPAARSPCGPALARATVSSSGWVEGLGLLRGRKRLAWRPAGWKPTRTGTGHGVVRRRVAGGGTEAVRTYGRRVPCSEELQVDSASVVSCVAAMIGLGVRDREEVSGQAG